MASELITIEIPPDSQLWEMLQQAAESGQRVRVASAHGDAAFEIDVHATRPDMSEAERIAHAVAVLRRATGSWKGLIDVDAFLEEHYERRRMASRPPVNFDR